MKVNHIMKWFAHTSPEMTLSYAKINDETLQTEWEKANENINSIYKVDLENGEITNAITDDDFIQWEYIKSNLEGAKIPLGYCMASKKEGCPYVVTPCLTCSNFCTTPENIKDFNNEIKNVEKHIEETKDYPIFNEKTKIQLENLVKVRDKLKDGANHMGSNVSYMFSKKG